MSLVETTTDSAMREDRIQNIYKFCTPNLVSSSFFRIIINIIFVRLKSSLSESILGMLFLSYLSDYQMSWEIGISSKRTVNGVEKVIKITSLIKVVT